MLGCIPVVIADEIEFPYENTNGLVRTRNPQHECHDGVPLVIVVNVISSGKLSSVTFLLRAPCRPPLE